MIRHEPWFRYAETPSWFGPTMTDPRVRGILTRLRDPKWDNAFKSAERLFGEISGAASSGKIQKPLFDALLDALEAYLDLVERRAELAALKGGRNTASWMHQAVSKLTSWMSGYL